MQITWRPNWKTDFINYFVCGLIVLPIVFKLIENISFFSTQYITYPLYGILWICLIIHISQNMDSFIYKALTLGTAIVLLCVLELQIFPENAKYIWGFNARSIITFIPENLFSAVLLIIPGLMVNDYEGFIKILHTFARAGVVVGCIAYAVFVVKGRELNYDDMNFSYTLCIMVCTLIATTQKRDSFFIVAGFLCMFIAGTRGPLICSIVAMVLKAVFFNRNSKKTVVYVLMGLSAIVLVQTGFFGVIINGIGDTLSSVGFDNLRIIELYNEGNISDSSGRDNLQDIVLQAIYQRPLRGWGVGADRLLLDGSYVHNIVLETICSFGVFFGGFFLLMLTIILVRAFFSKNKNIRLIAFIFISSVVLKMFSSSSIFACREFSIFLGICVGGLINSKAKHLMQREKNEEIQQGKRLI